MSKLSFLVAPIFIVILILGADLYMPVLFSLLRRLTHTKMAAMAGSGVRSYTSGENSLMYVMVPNMETARKLAKPLIQNKQAACVNIVPGVTSIYEWEGKIEEDSELIMFIKTSTARVEEISTFIRENHPYDVAAAISVKIDSGNPPFLDWISKTVAGKPDTASEGKSKET